MSALNNAGDELVQSSSASSGAVALEGQARRDAHGRVGDQCICNPEYSAQALPSSSQHEVHSVQSVSNDGIRCIGTAWLQLQVDLPANLELLSETHVNSAGSISGWCE